jgi:hypothetical protein
LDRREAPEIGTKPSEFSQLSDCDLAPLVEYFKILDRWNKEGQGQQDHSSDSETFEVTA